MKPNAMKILHLLTVFLLFSSFCSVLSHPSRPLNERTTELALQEAWLLIDDQNQSRQNIPDMMRRKIVAKSVFIAPTFKPEELPPCADGYTSDAMGRCVKIIQLDPDEHLKFLFQKLVGNFGASPDESQEEGMPTSGPVQFSIDLDLAKNSQEESDDSLKSTDVALVFTTSKTKPPQRGDEPVQDDQTRTDTGNLNPSFVPAPTNGSFDPDKINVKNEEKYSGDTETTATATVSITETTTEPVYSTTLSFGDETPTTPPETTTTTQTEAPEFTTTPQTGNDENHDGHALFFKVPSPPEDNSRIKFEDESMNNDQPEVQDSTNANDGSSTSRIVFKDEEHPYDLGDLMTSENVRHPSHRIRFPDERDRPLHLENGGSLYQFRRPQRQNQKPNLLQINHQRPPESDPDFDRSQQPPPEFVFNHRNRDKNHWQLPSTWRDSSPKKALVLRFSRMPGQGNFTLGDVNRRRFEPLFRQVRIEDLSYIFGHRRKRSNR